MSRDQLESCMGDIILDAGTRREYVHTGGSSGRPLVFPKTAAEEFFIHEFFSQGTRGFVQERRMPPTATLKIRRSDEEEAAGSSAAAEVPVELKAKAG